MKSHIVGLLTAAVLVSIPPRAHADAIVQPLANGFPNTIFFGPFGQTFTAEDVAIDTVGVLATQFHDLPDAFSLRYDLYEGVGASGMPIASRTFTGSGSFFDFADVSFAGVPLVVGNTYSLILTGSSRMGVFVGESNTNPYPGGTALWFNLPQPSGDLAFHVLPA